MDLAVSTYSLSRWMREENRSLNEAIAWISEVARGIEFVNIGWPVDEDPIERAAKLKRQCDRYGLTVVNYCTGAELLVQDDETQRKRIEFLKTEVLVSQTLGSPSMRHDVTWGFPDDWDGEQNFDAALSRIVPAIREVTMYGRANNIRTSVENHGFFMQASDRVEKLVQAVDHPNYGVTLDIGNFLCVNENPVSAVARLAKYTTMAHIKDFHKKPKDIAPTRGWFPTPTDLALRGAIVGHGEIDLAACLRHLKNAGYNSWLSLEFEGIENPKTGVEMGLEYSERLLEGLGVQR